MKEMDSSIGEWKRLSAERLEGVLWEWGIIEVGKGVKNEGSFCGGTEKAGNGYCRGNALCNNLREKIMFSKTCARPNVCLCIINLKQKTSLSLLLSQCWG
jgi:hypothetical protein